MLVAAHRDPAMRQWSTRPLADEEAARRWIDEQHDGWTTGTRLSFAVLESDHPIGHVVVKAGSDPGVASAEVGYWTLPEARGRGIAPRALETLSRWALGEQRLIPADRLDLVHAIGNHASCRVAEKCQYALHSLLPAQPPTFPTEAHLHVRPAAPSPGQGVS